MAPGTFLARKIATPRPCWMTLLVVVFVVVVVVIVVNCSCSCFFYSFSCLSDPATSSFPTD